MGGLIARWWATLWGCVYRLFARFGLAFTLLMIVLIAVLLYIWRQEHRLTPAQAVFVVGIIGALSVVSTQDEIKYREQRRSAFAEVVATAQDYFDCFDDLGNQYDETRTEVAREQVLKACARMHLLFRSPKTQTPLDDLTLKLGRLEGARTQQWATISDDAHHAIQEFIKAARKELGLADGKITPPPPPTGTIGQEQSNLGWPPKHA